MESVDIKTYFNVYFDISSCVFYNDLDYGNYDRRGRDLQAPLQKRDRENGRDKGHRDRHRY